jgi:hypothetical protein
MRAPKKIIVYTYRGDTERVVRGSYKWFPGYSETSPEGHEYAPWMTKGECQRDAKAQGGVAKCEEKP